MEPGVYELSGIMSLGDTLGAGLVILDPQQYLHYANRRFWDMLGVGEAQGRDLLSLMPEWARLVASVPFEHVEVKLSRRDGSRVWVSVSASQIRLEDALPAILVLFSDIQVRKQMEENQALILDILTTTFCEEFFVMVTRKLSEVFGADLVFISECNHDASVRTIAFWQSGCRRKNKTYKLKGTPCETVVGREPAYYATEVRSLFPQDASLEEAGADSYVGVPLADSQGRSLGHVALMHSSPFPNRFELMETLHIIGSRIASEIERNRREALLEDSNRRLKQELAARERADSTVAYFKDEIVAGLQTTYPVGQSAAFAQVVENIKLVSQTDASVLITGETGTGKELVARMLHEQSARSASILVKVNCSALPQELIEAELFGHEKGAFTSAQAQRKGRFELADGGTLFLDEIGELSLSAQVKLLRVLQEKEFERVGGSQPIKVDFRLVAATNRDLEEMVRKGSFREDLFYRLNVFPLQIPPLRERLEDLPQLAHFFLQKFSRSLGKHFTGFQDGTIALLQRHDWPGNIRELENLIHRSAILSPGPLLKVSLVPRCTGQGALSLEDVERNHIAMTLDQCDWRIEGPLGAAQLLGINPSTLRSRIKKLGLQRQS